MTVRLYDRDVDMLEFSAVVKTCEQREKGYIVTLDQTAFFPEGGGQGADHGTLDGVQVLDAHEANGEVEHLVSGPLAVGSEVRGHVDAVRPDGHDAAAQRRAHVLRSGAWAFRL